MFAPTGLAMSSAQNLTYRLARSKLLSVPRIHEKHNWRACGSLRADHGLTGTYSCADHNFRIADHPPGNHCQEARVSIFSTI